MTLSEGSSTLHAPFTNEPYSNISGDFNPIHINPYFSEFASLLGTIMQWSLFSGPALSPANTWKMTLFKVIPSVLLRE